MHVPHCRVAHDPLHLYEVRPDLINVCPDASPRRRVYVLTCGVELRPFPPVLLHVRRVRVKKCGAHVPQVPHEGRALRQRDVLVEAQLRCDLHVCDHPSPKPSYMLVPTGQVGQHVTCPDKTSLKSSSVSPAAFARLHHVHNTLTLTMTMITRPVSSDLPSRPECMGLNAFPVWRIEGIMQKKNCPNSCASLLLFLLVCCLLLAWSSGGSVFDQLGKDEQCVVVVIGVVGAVFVVVVDFSRVCCLSR